MLVAAVAWFAFLRGGDEPTELKLGEFQAKIAEGQVKNATYLARDSAYRGELADGRRYTVLVPREFGDRVVTQALLDHRVELQVESQRDSWLMTLIGQYLPVLLLLGRLRLLHVGDDGRRRRHGRDAPRPPQGQARRQGRAHGHLRRRGRRRRGRRGAPRDQGVPREPGQVPGHGGQDPQGRPALRPARAPARRCWPGPWPARPGAPFFSISGSDFVEMFVGVGASRVRDLFEQAKSARPGDRLHRRDRRRRAATAAPVSAAATTSASRPSTSCSSRWTASTSPPASSSSPPPTGPTSSTRRCCAPVASTARSSSTPPDLTRPAGHPRRARQGQAAGRRRRPRRASPAARPASPVPTWPTRSTRPRCWRPATARPTIAMRRVEEAIDRVLAGPERKSRVMADKEKQVIAYHEAGHALVGHVLPNTDPIHKVSIIARGRALGWTLALPAEDRHLKTRSELRDEMAMLLGGRTAEELIFGDPTTGAQNDIERATQIARAMVTQYGMSDADRPPAARPALRRGVPRQGGGPPRGQLLRRGGRRHRRRDPPAASTRPTPRPARSSLLHRATLDQLADALVAHETLGDDAAEASSSATSTSGSRGRTPASGRARPGRRPAPPPGRAPSARATAPGGFVGRREGYATAEGDGADGPDPAPPRF